MLDTHRRQDLTRQSICSTCTCTTRSSNARWSDVSMGSSFSPTFFSSTRPILKSNRRFIIPLVPPAWSPVSPTSPQTTLRDFCLPRQELHIPVNVLNCSSLSACSPSLAKFSRTNPGQNVSTSTSTTTLPSTIHATTLLHPTKAYLTVNGLKTHHHHYHHHRCRHTR